MRNLTFAAVIALALLKYVYAQNAAYRQDPGWHAPAEAADRRNPLAGRPEVAGGGKSFSSECVSVTEKLAPACPKKMPRIAVQVVQAQSDGTLFWKITNGNPDRGMPTFRRLPELQRWQLVLYLRKLSRPLDTRKHRPD